MYKFHCCLVSQVGTLPVVFLHLTIFLAVICGGKTYLNPLTLFLSKPQIARDVSLGLSHPKYKEPPIEVTVGGEAPVTPV